MNKKLNLEDIKPISSISESFSHAAHDYIFSHIILKAQPEVITPETFKFDGITVAVVLKGQLNVNINANVYHLGPGTATIMGPTFAMSASADRDTDTELYTLFLSHEFINSIHFDINVINPRHFIDHEPTLQMDENETALICRYFNLLHECAVNNGAAPSQLEIITRNIGRSIVVALLYQLALIAEKRQLVTKEISESRPSRSRKLNYVHEFMRLLQENYRRERSVGFYASQLCISPKYLSLLVREATGHTAATIIDRYVINEAKNMLRFSGYTIQQVSYKLNFPNQSAFGKYFKHITGVSPTTFRSN